MVRNQLLPKEYNVNNVDPSTLPEYLIRNDKII